MTNSASYKTTFRSDLAAIYERLRPKSVGCFDLADLSFVPLELFVRGGSEAWFVDGNAGRAQALLGEELSRADSCRACVACNAELDGKDVCFAYAPFATDAGTYCRSMMAIPRDPTRCAQFVPGRKLRIVHGDTGLGRGAGFATRIETIIATAATPLDAVEEAISVCKRSAHMNIPLPIEDGSLDLVVSVLAPSRLMEQPYAYFDDRMTRRFGTWTENPPAKLVKRLRTLRIALFQMQLEAHVRELARLVHPRNGRLYFATVPTEPAMNGVWSLERGVAECFETLARHFVFDFETFPPEAFLRRSRDDRSVVLQAALLCPKLAEGSTPP